MFQNHGSTYTKSWSSMTWMIWGTMTYETPWLLARPALPSGANTRTSLSAANPSLPRLPWAVPSCWLSLGSE